MREQFIKEPKERTIVDTLADSYVLKTSEVSGFAEMACKRKHRKYRVFENC
jgi:hypothetical protein